MPVRWLIKDGKLQVEGVDDDQPYEVKALNENQFRLALAPIEFTFLPVRAGGHLTKITNWPGEANRWCLINH